MLRNRYLRRYLTINKVFEKLFSFFFIVDYTISVMIDEARGR